MYFHISNIYLIFKIILYNLGYNISSLYQQNGIEMYDIKWFINYSYYLTYSINNLHCLPDVTINSKKSRIST
jgi:hypothetical protein